MPVMDGLTATRAIRRLETDGTLKYHVPIIGVSANARQEQREGMLQAGEVEFESRCFQAHITSVTSRHVYKHLKTLLHARTREDHATIAGTGK